MSYAPTFIVNLKLPSTFLSDCYFTAAAFSPLQQENKVSAALRLSSCVWNAFFPSPASQVLTIIFMAIHSLYVPGIEQGPQISQ